MIRNEQQSYLLRLPPELRNKIYALAVGGKEIFLTSVDSTSRRFILASKPQEEEWLQDAPYRQDLYLTALHKVFRQLYNDTAVLHFSRNTWSGTASELANFLDICGSGRQYIETIRVFAMCRELSGFDADTKKPLSML